MHHVGKLIPWLAATALATCSHPAPADPAAVPAGPPADGPVSTAAVAAEEAETDSPDAAMAWHMQRLRDENGVIDPQGPARARAQRDALVNYTATLENAGIGRYGWVERGPANTGGRTRSLVIDPTDPNRMWAGSVGGGLWRSTDGGATWAPVDDFMGNLAVCCMAIHPNPRRIYVGTGEGFYNGDAIRGRGIWRSVDGGATWQQLPATANWQHVNRIAIFPGNWPPNPDILAAAVQPGGLYFSTDDGATWYQQRAADAGMQVAYDPNNMLRALATVRDPGDIHRVVRSTNGAGNWNNVTSGLAAQAGFDRRIELAWARTVPDLVYACVNGFCWRSTDGGSNWTIRSGTGLQGHWWYDNAIWVDPTDANVVVIGGVHLHRSIDGGQTFTQISNGYIQTVQPHPDVHAIVAHPGYNGSTNRRVYVCTDGGIWRTDDIRTASTFGGWTRLDQGYRTTQFYGAAGDATVGRVVGGTQDNGTLVLNGSSTAAGLMYGGDGGFVAMDYTNPNYVYGEGPYLTLVRSTNGGISASPITTGLSDAGVAANFIAPFVLDSNDQRRLYAGGDRLWRTQDARAANVSWTAIKPSVGSYISAIAVKPTRPEIVWVGHSDGRVYRTATANQVVPTWIAVDDNAATNPLPNRYITSIAFGESPDDTRVYVTLGGWTSGNVQRSDDRGVTFASVTQGGTTPPLPDAPVHSLVFSNTSNHLFVGTEVGVFATEVGGWWWSATNDGPADVRVDQLALMNGLQNGQLALLAATHGRGLWTIELHQPRMFQLGTGCAGTAGTPFLSSTPPRIGEDVLATCTGLRPNGFGFLVVGFSRTVWNGMALPASLNIFGLTGCTAYCSVDLSVGGLGNAAGEFRQSFRLLPDRGTLGGSLYLQVLGIDPGANPGGAVTSNGVHLLIGN